jgi:hypothetical protein
MGKTLALTQLQRGSYRITFFKLGSLVRGQILSLSIGTKVDSGIGLSYLLASLYLARRRAATTTLCQSQLYPPRQGLRILPLTSNPSLKKVILLTNRCEGADVVIPEGNEYVTMAVKILYM